MAFGLCIISNTNILLFVTLKWLSVYKSNRKKNFGIDSIHLQLFGIVLVIVTTESHQSIVVKWDFKSSFDSRDFARECARASFLHWRKRVSVLHRKKKRRFVFSTGYRVGKAGFFLVHPHLLYSHHRAIFPGEFSPVSSAGARLVIGGRCRSNSRRPVSICRSDYFVLPKRGGCLLSPAIRNFLPILLSRAACCPPRNAGRMVTSHFVRPSFKSGV